MLKYGLEAAKRKAMAAFSMQHGCRWGRRPACIPPIGQGTAPGRRLRALIVAANMTTLSKESSPAAIAAGEE
jgi:hypothetical protein